MLHFIMLKILVYGLVMCRMTPFLVEKRTKVLDHASLNTNQTPNITTTKDIPDSEANENGNKNTVEEVDNSTNAMKKDQKNPADVQVAANKLDDLEKMLQIYPQNFIEHRETIKKQIESNIRENEKDYEGLRQKLGLLDSSSPENLNKILQWMKIKKKEIDLYKEDLKLIDDISSIVTKLEAAKFISLNNLNNQNYVEQPSYTPVYYTYPYQYEGTKLATPYYANTYTIPQQTSYTYSPIYYANEKSKYDLFSEVFNKRLNLNSYPINYGTYNSEYNTLSSKRFSFGKKPTTASQSNNILSDDKIISSKNEHYKVYAPPVIVSRSNDKNINSQAYTKSTLNNDKPRKDTISVADTEKAVNAINYLQNKLGLDTMSVLRFISELKESTKNEMNFHKQQLQNNLLEYKRSSILKPTEDLTKRSQIADDQSAFLESRDKYWLIKQVEWFITRLEAAKYAAMSKIV